VQIPRLASLARDDPGVIPNEVEGSALAPFELTSQTGAADAREVLDSA
jgi:hypothetical protein